MQITRHPPVKTSLEPSNHPYLTGPWTPLHEEADVAELHVIEGVIPADIDGIYLRNTENQVHQPLGRHHPFDGDAMIHQVNFSGGKASYRNRFVRTHCFEAEQIAGQSLWGVSISAINCDETTRPAWSEHTPLLRDSRPPGLARPPGCEFLPASCDQVLGHRDGACLIIAYVHLLMHGLISR